MITLMILISLSSTSATVLFFNNSGDFFNNLTTNNKNTEQFITTGENATLADEVNFPANSSNLDISNVLTWRASNTGLARDFRLSTPRDKFVFNEVAHGLPGGFSPGGTSSGIQQDDDWTLEILSGIDLFAFGFNLQDSDNNSGETLSVFSNNTLIGTFTNLPTGNNRFIGIISSDSPITKIVMDESGSDGENIAIRDFTFDAPLVVVPEPTSFILLGLTLIGLCFKKK